MHRKIFSETHMVSPSHFMSRASNSGSLSVPHRVFENYLNKTYSDPHRAVPLPAIEAFVMPTGHSHPFDLSDLSWCEIQEGVQIARVKSAPGPNGLSYKLLKKCPKVLNILWRLAWKKMLVHSNWCLAAGMYIPKEADSAVLNPFRSISLLSVEGKVLFGVLDRRMTKVTMENGYINISVQKAGIPQDFQGVWNMQAWYGVLNRKQERRRRGSMWSDRTWKMCMVQCPRTS